MPNHPLLGVAAKLDRATQHIRELDATIREFKRLNPDVFGTQLDPQTGHFAHTIRHTGSELDTSRLSIIAGEVLHQLRSSLDHTVARLLMKIHASNPELDNILERSEFPILTKPTHEKPSVTISPATEQMACPSRTIPSQSSPA